MPTNLSTYPLFTVDPDITRAVTIPAECYTDPHVLHDEREKIFRKTWQFASSIDELQHPDSYVAVDIVGVPVVLTKGHDNVIRAFYNVCRHRAGVVAEGCGIRKTLQCQYHGWTYALDGSLMHTPEFDGVVDFDKQDFGLLPIQCEVWRNFVFVNLDNNAQSLSDTLGEITSETDGYGFDSMYKVERRDYTLNANWKLYVDNFLEGYHIPVAHPGLYKEIDYANYVVETRANHSVQYAPIRPVRDGSSDERRYKLEGDAQARYYWMFPNLMLNIYQGMLQVNVIVPLAYDKTRTIFEWYLPNGASHELVQTMKDSMLFSDEIQAEDIKLCEDVWRNLNSGAYRQGRYSPKRENGVHHFHGLLGRCLG